MSLPKSSKHQEMKHHPLEIGTITIGIGNPNNQQTDNKRVFLLHQRCLRTRSLIFNPSCDTKSLFPSTILTQTLSHCIKIFCRNQTHVCNLIWSFFYDLLKITMRWYILIFDGKFYEQCNNVAMGSALGLRLDVFEIHLVRKLPFSFQTSYL